MSFEKLPRDADHRQALATEAQARGDAFSMRRAYVRSDLAAVAWRGREHTRIDRENRELEEAITTRDETMSAGATDKARCHADLATVA
jgi:hypothetical protein